MSVSPKLVSVLSLPFAGVLISFCFWHFLVVSPSLTQPEKDLLAFTPVKVAFHRPVTRLVSGINCPIPPSPPPSATEKNIQSTYPPVPLKTLLLPLGSAARKELTDEPVYSLSLVLISEGRKMAILNGHVLKEGERFGSQTVALIEKNRVSLKGPKGELWVNLK